MKIIVYVLAAKAIKNVNNEDPNPNPPEDPEPPPEEPEPPIEDPPSPPPFG
jgi:hypothetical protein